MKCPNFWAWAGLAFPCVLEAGHEQECEAINVNGVRNVRFPSPQKAQFLSAAEAKVYHEEQKWQWAEDDRRGC